MDEKKGAFIEKLKNKKTLEIIFVFLLSIIALIVILSVITPKKTENQTSFDKYMENLENKLTTALKKVENVGEVNVVINVCSTPETVLAMETTTTETGSGKKTVTKPVIVGGETVVLREEIPKITGVLIVAEGANNLLVKSKLINSASTLLDVEPEKIEILTMK